MTNSLFSLTTTLMLLFILAAISFFFAASETAIIGLSKIRLRHMLSLGLRRAGHIQRLVTRLDKFIAAILIGNNFVNIAMSSIITVIFVHLFGYRLGIVGATFISTVFILLFCEITPKILATKHAEKIALFASPIMEIFIAALHPVVSAFTKVSSFILRISGVEITKRSPLITEEEIRMMIEVGKEEGVLSDEERRMLYRIFEFGDTHVNEVMIPKEKIIAISTKATTEELLNVFVEEGHTRLPVYDGSIDNIIGIIFARNLLYILKNRSLFLLQDLINQAYYIAPTMRVNELLRKFQTDKIQIAIVVDAKQQTLGLVTLEDLLEEIVGELEEQPFA